MNAKHTPGPWRCYQGGVGQWSVGTDAPNGILRQHICSVNRREFSGHAAEVQDDNRANARLIAAAPELLDALRMLMSSRDDDGIICVSGIAAEIIEDAIAKAEGR